MHILRRRQVFSNSLLDVGTLKVDRLIIHEIPRRIIGEPLGLQTSEAESPLNQADKNFFAEKIKASLARSSYRVRFNPELETPTPKHVIAILSKEKDNFVSISQSLASHLHACQTGVNPPGILIIAKIRIASKNGLAILKLEKEEGMSYEASENDDGLAIYDVKQIKNLMLTGGKVFKVGVFVQEGKTTETVAGYVSDKQRGIRANSEVAKFFLEDFLGCCLVESPEVTTKKFFKTFQDFINDSVDDPEKKAKYDIALLALMQNAQETVNPTDFASKNLELGERQRFMNRLKENDIPTNDFPKDTSSIKSHIKSFRFNFNDNSSSISITGSLASFQDVQIQNLDDSDGRVRVTFEAELRNIGS